MYIYNLSVQSSMLCLFSFYYLCESHSCSSESCSHSFVLFAAQYFITRISCGLSIFSLQFYFSLLLPDFWEHPILLCSIYESIVLHISFLFGLFLPTFTDVHSLIEILNTVTDQLQLKLYLYNYCFFVQEIFACLKVMKSISGNFIILPSCILEWNFVDGVR